MPETEAHRWWDDVAHLRDAIERRRADEVGAGTRRREQARAADLDDEAFLRRQVEQADRGPRAPRRDRHLVAVADDELPFSERALRPPEQRRTVQITGRTIGAPSLPRLVEVDRRRPPRSSAHRIGHRPDRLALWAVLLAFFLILVAATSSSHAATPHAAPPHVAATR
jgi:hypothetical protein